jgi:PAS domain S-box-containing protein
VLNDESPRLPKYPRKLLLLSPHPAEEKELRAQLHRAEEGIYELLRVATLAEFKRIHLQEDCHAVLLDMRIEHEDALQAIQLIGNLSSTVALLCLCRNHKELLTYKDVIHLVDDYILTESLEGSELSTRIMHAIRRKAKESSLVVEQSLLTSLLENVPDNIYFKDLKSRFIKVSVNMLKCYGYSSNEQLLGKTDFDLFTEEHARQAFEDEKEIIRSAKPMVGKIEKETLPDGRVNWVSSTKIPLRDANGQIIGTMGMSRIVTELKEAQDKLALETRLLKTVIDHALAGIFVKDTEGRYLIVNRRHANYLGAKSVKDVIGKTLYNFFSRKEADKISAADAEIMQSHEGIENMTDHCIRPDVPDLWLLTSKVPLHDEHGACIGLVGISQDITSQKNTEDSLAQERNLLRTILDNVPDRIFVKDWDGRYIASNTKHLKFLGAISEKEVLGTTICDHVEAEIAKKYMAVERQIIETSIGILNAEEYRTDEDGTTRWYLTSKVPLINTNGKTAGLVGIARDITEQKKNEAALKNTIEILNDTKLQLIEAEKLKTVGRLAAGVAHEVKNPLAVVSLGVEYLKKRLKNKTELVELLEDMRMAVDKANEVVFELLDYSSPHELSMLPTPINQVIIKVLGLMRHNLNEAHVTMVQDLEPDLPLVSMDASKMEQVFINLFLNAIGAMPEGGELIVHTHVQRMQQAGSNVSSQLSELFRIGDQMITVDVTDTGHGVEAKEKDKLFDPFFSTKSTGKGTGLGLSVTRSIVDMHRGMITLENRTDGAGAHVRLVFPTNQDHET